jgi:delta 1-pyrroline-5-carboxylate dehydrogenase
MEIMNQKQKEALVIAMRENGKSYRDIVREVKMSPNTQDNIE